jgi:hypothetical protein
VVNEVNEIPKIMGFDVFGIRNLIIFATLLSGELPAYCNVLIKR